MSDLKSASTHVQATRIPIQGMTCASCGRRVERALAKVDGVTEASVNLATERATVQYDPDRVTSESLARAVAHAGYDAGPIELPLETPSSSEATTTPALDVTIEGMTCASCVRRVERAIEIEQVDDHVTRVANSGATPMFAAVDGRLAGVIAVADTLKPESHDALQQLRALELDLWMITGDNQLTANAIGQQLGIDHVIAEVLPDRKASKVHELQEAGAIVAMVGDGINDAPTLATADLGIAIGTGTDVAIAASDITLIGGDMRTLVMAIALSRRTVQTIRQGLFWAFAYNIALIPVAIGVLYPAFGILLNPVLAAAAMAMSSVSVVSNALRLRQFLAPTSVDAILHPPISRRVQEWGYLVGIAVIALGIGIVAFWLGDRVGMGAGDVSHLPSELERMMPGGTMD